MFGFLSTATVLHVSIIGLTSLVGAVRVLWRRKLECRILAPSFVLQTLCTPEEWCIQNSNASIFSGIRFSKIP